MKWDIEAGKIFLMFDFNPNQQELHKRMKKIKKRILLDF